MADGFAISGLCGNVRFDFTFLPGHRRQRLDCGQWRLAVIYWCAAVWRWPSKPCALARLVGLATGPIDGMAQLDGHTRELTSASVDLSTSSSCT